METKETNQGGYIGSAKIAEPKSKKGLGMTLTEAIGELEKGHKITCDASSNKDRYAYLDGKHIVNSETGERTNFEAFKIIAHDDKNVWRIYEPKLKNATQQKRVELIETQKWELIAATATIDNQAATIKELNSNINNIEKSRLELIEQNDKLAESAANLVRTKMRNDSAIKDLTERNGNLTRITNDQTERIEVMQHELKNYESATKVIETKYNSLCTSMDNLETTHANEISNIKESRERLASKFTNWFIFLVFIVCVELAVIVAMILRAVNYNLPIF